MPRSFDKCRAAGGNILNGKVYPGEVKTKGAVASRTPAPL
jgi:hypothetical protein